jgi:predicted RNA-binding Zn-ribbon protein involved in translation (DUF1610 family)
MGLLKTNGRLHNAKTMASEQPVRSKLFICSNCGERQLIHNVEFGTKYMCAKCGQEMAEKI